MATGMLNLSHFSSTISGSPFIYINASLLCNNPKLPLYDPDEGNKKLANNNSFGII